MSFFKSLVTTTARNIHDGAIKTVANWNPDLVGESQLEEWNQKAKELATMAAKAAAEYENQKAKVANLTNDVAKYTAAAEKLASTNEPAANQAADRAIELSNELDEATLQMNDAKSWAEETMASATTAQEKVVSGRTAIENAKREQARANQQKTIAQEKLRDRERLAGINTGLDGADVAIDALRKNAAAAKQEAAAANIRANVLSKNVETDDAINAALAEVDHTSIKNQSLADKLNALKKQKVAE